jgi:hypothetical protein
MAQTEGSIVLGIIDFGKEMGKKITVVTIDNKKLNDGVNGFFITTIFEFLAASNTMVADESGWLS